MDAYEATKIVYSRIQGMDPENAAKIMGLLLIQDHGEKEMIRLAFGPEAMLHSLVLKARKELGLLLPTPSSPFSKQQQPLTPSSSRLPSPSSWASAPVFSRTNGGIGDEDDLLGSNLHYGASPFYGGGDLIDELQLQEQLPFINENVSPSPKDLFHPDMANEWGGASWGHHRRSCSAADLYDGLAWKPCMYYARGFCKNGSACRFQHGLLQDDSKVDPLVEQELLLKSKSQRLSGGLGSAAAAASFAYGTSLPSGKCMNFLLQQQLQHSESQRAAAAAAASLILDEPHKFMGRSRIDFATMVNPGSRQIYLTFPADSTFREEDVSNYFSIYGPVQDVRIPYQQKRMFGFVTFVYPETVKLILAKGNPHFVCDARVLVKPYKEKGKLPDKKHQQLDRGDFSGGSTTPTGLDSRESYELQQLGARYLFNNGQEAFIRRKLEEQQQAADLQQAIELQSRRFMGLQLLDLKNRGLSLPVPYLPIPSPIATPTTVTTPSTTITSPSAGDTASSEDLSSPVTPVPDVETHTTVHPAGEEESIAEKGSTNKDCDFQESAEHNLPDSPFASPIKSSCFNEVTLEVTNSPSSLHGNGRLLAPPPPLDTASFKSCFLPMPRLTPGHKAIGM